VAYGTNGLDFGDDPDYDPDSGSRNSLNDSLFTIAISVDDQGQNENPRRGFEVSECFFG